VNILRDVFVFVFEIFFGCRHDHLTRPFTLERQTYKVCLDCGKQVFYSADTMRPLSAREVRRLKAADAGEVKVIPAPTGPQLVSVSGQNPNAAA
jgi:hypothetical protein